MRKLSIFLFSLLLVLLNIDSRPGLAAELTGYNYLNNGYIQFTGDFANTGDFRNLPITSLGEAVNDYGNLNNPYYFDGSVWRPLTLSRKMEYALSEGGTLVNAGDSYSVSGAGTIVYPATDNTALSNFRVDGSGIVKTELSTTAGSATYTGTLISIGEITVNSKTLEIKNTYTLLEGKSFVKVKTKITNLDPTQSVTNLRYWVGTGDDWISTDDRNYKTRGNIVDGAFVQSATTTEQSKAIRVDSQSGTDSILFYSTHPNANTSINGCCSFSNAVQTNPYGCITNTFNDGSYALFVNLGTIAVGAYAEFDWYYAAGSASTILDTINDVALDSSGASEITGSSATLKYTSETLTTGYYMVLSRGSSVPTADQIVDTSLYTSSTIIKNGNSTMPAGTETPFEITGLSPGSDYDVYFVTRNANGDTSSVAVTQFSTEAFAIISLTTIDSIDFPKNNRLPDVEEIDTVEYTATVSWSPADDQFKDDVAYVATITVTPKDGYTLTGVSANAFTVSGASTTTNSVNSGIITATFPKVIFDKVIFHSNGGTSVDQLGVDVDALITKPSDPTRVGYSFVAWYQDNNTFENPWTFATEVMPLSDLDLYAKWSASSYSITYILNGGTNFMGAESSYTIESSSIELGIPTKAGYTFGGWYKNADLTTGGVITSISSGSHGNLSLYAKWTTKAYSISYQLNGGINFEDAFTTYTTESSSILLGTPTKIGYVFAGWYKNEDLVTGGRITTLLTGSTGDLTLYAKWILAEYSITYQLDNGIIFEDVQFLYTIQSSSIELGIPTKIGYTFDGWYGNADLSSGGEITSIASGSTGDIILYAKWISLPVEITSDPTLEVKLEGAAEAVPFTPDELIQEVSVKLEMVMVEQTNLDPEELTIMNDFLETHVDGDVQHVILFDFSLFKVVGDQETAITSTTSLIKITFLVPEEYRGQELHIIRIHDGVADLLEATYNAETFELTFYTDKFSTYGLAYGSLKLPNTRSGGGNSVFYLLMSLCFGSLVMKKKIKN